MEFLRLAQNFEDKMDGASKTRFNIKTAGSKGWVIGGNSGQEYHLTKREFQILFLVCSYGVSNEQLEKGLGLKNQTVRNYISSIAKAVKIGEANEFNTERDTKLDIIEKLLREGALTYLPRISEEKTPIYQFKKDSSV